MFAIVVREAGDAAAIEADSEHVATAVVPRVRQAPGFVSAIWLADGSGGTLNVLAFESEAAARAAMERIRDAGRPDYLRLESVAMYRVIATA